jgi:hypothetical protein
MNLQTLKQKLIYKLMVLGSFFKLPISVLAVDLAAIKDLAMCGNTLAQYNLGLMYDKGQGVSQSSTTAAQWYQKAADQGHICSQYNLGLMYESGLGVHKNSTTAAYWYRKAAEQGHANSQYNLGLMYEYGLGVRHSHVEAKEWFGKSCDSGNQDGCDKFYSLNE